MSKRKMLQVAAVVALGCAGDALGVSQSLNTVYSFAGGTTDGRVPAGSALFTGNSLIGMTTFGGSNNDGAIYQYNLSTGTEKILYSFQGTFTGKSDPSENYGAGSLALFGSTLYGITNEGGSVDVGTVFSYTLGASTDNVLHSFLANDVDGTAGTGFVVPFGSSLYGVTRGGGTASGGTLLAINVNNNNQETVLHNFTGTTSDGSEPAGGLVKVGSTFYGLTEAGGVGGTIYSFNTTNSAVATRYTFNGPNDGSYPYGQLLASGSILYGTTSFGGANGMGTIFQYDTTTGLEQVLYSFGTTDNTGQYPMSGLVQSGPFLYGSTSQDGANPGYGSVFAYNINSGAVTVVTSLPGDQLAGSLTLSGTTLYGATINGGINNDGIIFSLQTLPVPEPAILSTLAITTLTLLTRRRRRVHNRLCSPALSG